ncbi:uncharacterized protein N7487_003787 [Penicillium crustosum]|uniref:uncharacterized protein n=1 Tax=Penicillium crustosum TaxID=36656 RepID=UPI00239697B2|nr:uncharacterized protein N7487_003787 [Penicillium crustosum]KAJ5409428.1 hypothetical protein N7487_003787 [Penicillium crustosum]
MEPEASQPMHIRFPVYPLGFLMNHSPGSPPFDLFVGNRGVVRAHAHGHNGPGTSPSGMKLTVLSAEGSWQVQMVTPQTSAISMSPSSYGVECSSVSKNISRSVVVDVRSMTSDSGKNAKV